MLHTAYYELVHLSLLCNMRSFFFFLSCCWCWMLMLMLCCYCRCPFTSSATLYYLIARCILRWLAVYGWRWGCCIHVLYIFRFLGSGFYAPSTFDYYFTQIRIRFYATCSRFRYIIYLFYVCPNPSPVLGQLLWDRNIWILSVISVIEKMVWIDLG